ncbi:hypothetical protein [Streptomyces acidicola]|uniref:NlpC/P60 domain-containing protein n=1 Tax=Streptomyces acidicola TaxID=2596892 RepID=A0A5N8WM47_9ACTN|nr:hypothetical protein [Streptomyces acidicola]MPY47166.1 hypothetical protein [Streptomyces acidicola]MPY47305.1 hypothetical protein [Streptomyces acidicola]
MPAISVGSVEVDVLPNAQGIQGRLRAALVPPASQIGDEVGRIIGRQIAAHMTPAIRDGIQDGARAARPAATRQGEQTGGAFARSLRARLEAAFRSMPRLDVRLSDTGVDADLARLRARLETLAGKTIGIDVDAATARAEAADIEERLRRIGAAHPNVAVRADTAAAITQLRLLQQQIDEVSGDPARIRVETDGGLGARLRAAVQQAEASLPNVNIGADTTPAQAEIASLRAQLTALRDARIGIDVDAATALSRIQDVQARLARLSTQDADVAVRVDAGAASAQLAAFQAQVNRLDGQTARVDVDTSSAVSSFGALATAAIAFGPAIIPALPVVAAGLGAIAAAATAAGAGIGSIALVAAPAFKGIASALQAQKAAQDAATNATYQGGQASSQGASKALQMASAQQALATAERNGARQIAQAQAAVGQAKRAAADAVAQAAVRNQQAARQVQDAERSLADAQRDAKRAQEDLTAARKQAEQELLDLNNQLTNARLSQRDAEIALKEAMLQRDAVLKNANATELDKQKALLQYDQAVQRLKEQREETKQLTTETAKANRKGVEGSDTVRNAQDRVAQSQRAVADQARALKDAQAEASRTQVETARQVADAQARVGEATANVAVAQQSAADAVASAQRQIQSASMSAAGGVDQAAVAQAKYQAELAKLTPSARETFNAFLNLRSAFSEWSKSLQPQVMPIFTRALDGMRRALPGLTPFVKEAAAAIGDLQDRASRGFKSPWWQTFKADLSGSVGPALVGLGVAFGNVFKGMGGVIQAFLPHMDSISSRMQTITARFATWGAGLKGSPQFERFLAYSAEQAPILSEMLGNLFRAFFDLGVALAPLGGTATSFINALATGISAIPTDLLTTVGVAFASIAIGAKLAAVAMGIWRAAQTVATVATALLTGQTLALNAAMRANLIGIIITAIAALVVAIIYAWQHWDGFRNVVLAVWNAIKIAALFVWNSVLKPVFTAIWTGLQTIGRWASWLWTNVLSPVFGFIATAAKILMTAVVTIALVPIIATFKILAATGEWLWNTVLGPAFRGIGAVASWLYSNAIKPAFNAIAVLAVWLWNNGIKPYFQYIRGGVSAVGAIMGWLYQKAVKPAWEGIKSAIAFVWDRGIQPIFGALKSAVARVADSFEFARKAIKIAWDKLKKIAREPVQFIVDTVYNGGIRGVWNKVAKAFGAPTLPAFKFASGGIMPGYTPGRDVHRFVSPTGGRLDLSGGEAIMRPEFTRAVGAGFVGSMNAIAKSRGAQGVKAALAPVFGGNPVTSTDRSLKYASGGVHQQFADGGIWGWVKSAAGGAGSAVWNGIKEGAKWLSDTVEGSLRAGVKSVVDPLLKNFPGMDTALGQMLRRIPTKILDTLFGYGKEADKRGAAGIGGPRIQAALKWAKSQNGKPYQWAGNGNPSWDCSGFMSAIESVIRGQKPHRRWATMAFHGQTAPPGWVKNGNSAFRVGITNAGVGHTAGTLGKTNVESRGGDGVVVGKRARGYNDRLFTSWYGFMPGKYDSGGYLQPGLNLAYNGTGRPEPVFTTSQANALTTMASRGAGPARFEGDLFLDSGEFLGRVRGEATAVMQEGQQQLIGVLNAS